MTSLRRSGEMLKLRLVPVVHSKEIRGGVGVVKLERVSVTCLACGQQVEAVASDGRVKGYCAVAKQHVDFAIETQLAPQSVVRIRKHPTAETRAKISAATKKRWQDPEFRAKQHALKGRHHTAETRAKLSASAKKHWQDPGYRAKQIAIHTGRHPSPETRAKISTAVTRHNRKRGK